MVLSDVFSQTLVSNWNELHSWISSIRLRSVSIGNRVGFFFWTVGTAIPITLKICLKLIKTYSFLEYFLMSSGVPGFRLIWFLPVFRLGFWPDWHHWFLQWQIRKEMNLNANLVDELSPKWMQTISIKEKWKIQNESKSQAYNENERNSWHDFNMIYCRQLEGFCKCLNQLL